MIKAILGIISQQLSSLQCQEHASCSILSQTLQSVKLYYVPPFDYPQEKLFVMSSQIRPGTQGTGFSYSQDPSFSYFDVGTQDPLSFTDFPEFSGLSQVSSLFSSDDVLASQMFFPRQANNNVV